MIMSAFQVLTTCFKRDLFYFFGLLEKPIEPSIRVQCKEYRPTINRNNFSIIFGTLVDLMI